MALPSTTLVIGPRSECSKSIDDLDYQLLCRRDLGLVYVQVGLEGQRWSTTRDGHHRVQIYDEVFTLDIASLIMDAG